MNKSLCITLKHTDFTPNIKLKPYNPYQKNEKSHKKDKKKENKNKPLFC